MDGAHCSHQCQIKFLAIKIMPDGRIMMTLKGIHQMKHGDLVTLMFDLVTLMKWELGAGASSQWTHHGFFRGSKCLGYLKGTLPETNIAHENPPF